MVVLHKPLLHRIMNDHDVVSFFFDEHLLHLKVNKSVLDIFVLVPAYLLPLFVKSL